MSFSNTEQYQILQQRLDDLMVIQRCVENALDVVTNTRHLLTLIAPNDLNLGMSIDEMHNTIIRAVMTTNSRLNLLKQNATI